MSGVPESRFGESLGMALAEDAGKTNVDSAGMHCGDNFDGLNISLELQSRKDCANENLD